MTLISLQSVGPSDGKTHEVYVESELVEGIEESRSVKDRPTSLVRMKEGDPYRVFGDPKTIFALLHPKPKRREQVRTFFNSSLGILLLSAVFVSGGGALWKWSTQTYSEHQARLARERLLMVEFDSRVSEIDSRRQQIDAFKSDEDKGHATLCIIHLVGGTGTCTIQNKPTLPLVNIVHELRGLGVVADPSAVFKTLGDIQAENGEVLNSANFRVYPDGLLLTRIDILRSYSTEAWRQVGKRY